MNQTIKLQMSVLDFKNLVNKKSIILSNDDLEKVINSINIKPTFFNEGVFGSLRVSEPEILEGLKKINDTYLLHLELI